MEKFRSTTNCQAAEGEELMPEKEAGPVDEEIEPELNTELLNMVTQMGIPENPAKHALYKTGNNNADSAVTWYFENITDQTLN